MLFHNIALRGISTKLNIKKMFFRKRKPPNSQSGTISLQRVSLRPAEVAASVSFVSWFEFFQHDEEKCVMKFLVSDCGRRDSNKHFIGLLPTGLNRSGVGFT